MWNLFLAPELLGALALGARRSRYGNDGSLSGVALADNGRHMQTTNCRMCSVKCRGEGLLIRLEHDIDTIGAKRVVLDSIESLFAGLTDPRHSSTGDQETLLS